MRNIINLIKCSQFIQMIVILPLQDSYLINQSSHLHFHKLNWIKASITQIWIKRIGCFVNKWVSIINLQMISYWWSLEMQSQRSNNFQAFKTLKSNHCNRQIRYCKSMWKVWRFNFIGLKISLNYIRKILDSSFNKLNNL